VKKNGVEGHEEGHVNEGHRSLKTPTQGEKEEERNDVMRKENGFPL